MTENAIQVEHLSKKYRIGGKQVAYKTFRESLVASARAPWSWLRGTWGRETNTFWALDDLSFEIKAGEAVGVIGRNGAGKSTLLKVLSRITRPTRGRVDLFGRVGSLLEVGTGFHPELTGRENVYLNGAILGMSRAEIGRKYDEIVAFADVEKFLDTPLKFYSSGMYVRLAFAVAAHLEPEILMVDEVLAVGDAAFQKKCLGKMSDVVHEGRTILFVSHNMGAIASLCQKCLLLESGHAEAFSNDVPGIIRQYLDASLARPSQNLSRQNIRTEYFEIADFRLLRTSDRTTAELFSRDEGIEVELLVDVSQADPSLSVGYALFETGSNNCLWWSFSVDTGDLRLKPGANKLRTSIPGALLNAGVYRIEVIAGLHNQKWILSPGQNTLAIEFTVAGGSVGSAAFSTTRRPTLLLPAFPWYRE